VEGEEEVKVDSSSIPCRTCGSPDDSEDPMVLCDDCDYGIHLNCHEPPLEELPQDDWFCPDCERRPHVGVVWIPLHDTDVDRASLCVNAGSHDLPRFSTTVSDGQVPKSFYSVGASSPWHAARFRAGDVVLLDLKAVSATTMNRTQKYSMAVDSRWCLAPKRENWGRTPSSRFIEGLRADKLFLKGLAPDAEDGDDEEEAED
jgi:NMD protein affecting ribosome stability and mRNA decay